MRVHAEQTGRVQRLRLRMAEAGDRLAVRAFLDRLSPTTVRARYLRPAASLAGPLGDRELERILARNAAKHVVVVAVDGAEIRGMGEFIREPTDRAELAVVVEDAFHGRGIGRRLLRKLERLAIRRGILAFTGDVAYGNARATALLRGSGRPLQMQFDFGSLRFQLLLE